MEVHDVGPLATYQVAQVVVRRTVPETGRRQGQPAHVRDVVVVHHECHDLVAELAQQAHFGVEDLILAAGLLVEVVRDENFHLGSVRTIAASSKTCGWFA